MSLFPRFRQESIQNKELNSTSNNQILFIPDVEKQYTHPLKEPINLKYFNFRGEPVYRQVLDLNELIKPTLIYFYAFVDRVYLKIVFL